MDDLTRQVNLIVESLLENESLTSNLDDNAAQLLLNWGIALTEKIVHSVVGLSNVEAEQVMYQRLRATRGLMRYINRWLPSRHDISAEKSLSQLEQIRQQAAIIYPDKALPDELLLRAFIGQSLAYSPEQTITELRRLFEGPSSRSLSDETTSNNELDSEPSQKEDELITSSQENGLMEHDEEQSHETTAAAAEEENNDDNLNPTPKGPTKEEKIAQIEPLGNETLSSPTGDDVTPDHVSIHLSKEAPTTQPVTYQYPVLYEEPKSTGLWGVVMNVIRSMTLTYRKYFSLEAHL